MRIGGGQRLAQFLGHAGFHGGGGALGCFQMAMRNQPAGAFRDSAANEPDEDGAHGADQDHPAPSVHSERLARHQRPRQQGDDGNHAELNDLVDGESAAAKMFGYEFGNVGVDGDQFHANADPGNQAPGNDADGSVLEGHDDGGGRVPQQGAGEDHAAPEPVGGETENHGAEEQAGERGGNKAGQAVKPKKGSGGTGEDAAAHQARSDIGGEKQVVHFKTSAQGEQKDELPDIFCSRKAVEASADFGGDGRVADLCQGPSLRAKSCR